MRIPFVRSGESRAVARLSRATRLLPIPDVGAPGVGTVLAGTGLDGDVVVITRASGDVPSTAAIFLAIAIAGRVPSATVVEHVDAYAPVVRVGVANIGPMERVLHTAVASAF